MADDGDGIGTQAQWVQALRIWHGKQTDGSFPKDHSILARVADDMRACAVEEIIFEAEHVGRTNPHGLWQWQILIRTFAPDRVRRGRRKRPAVVEDITHKMTFRLSDYTVNNLTDYAEDVKTDKYGGFRERRVVGWVGQGESVGEFFHATPLTLPIVEAFANPNEPAHLWLDLDPGFTGEIACGATIEAIELPAVWLLDPATNGVSVTPACGPGVIARGVQVEELTQRLTPGGLLAIRVECLAGNVPYPASLRQPIEMVRRRESPLIPIETIRDTDTFRRLTDAVRNRMIRRESVRVENEILHGTGPRQLTGILQRSIEFQPDGVSPLAEMGRIVDQNDALASAFELVRRRGQSDQSAGDRREGDQ